MSRSWRYVAILIACACTGAVVVARQKPLDADSKEIAAYRLTAPALKKVININRTMVQVLLQDPKVQEGLKIDRELEALGKKEEPTEADEKRMAELEARKEQLEDAADNPLGGDAKTLDEMEARIKKYPPMAQALQREGMTPREYATFWMAFLQAAFAQGFQEAGMLKELPAGVSPENVKFVTDHAAEIKAIQEELELLGKGK